MDKIQEMHINVCNTGLLRRGSMEMSIDHATITEDLMGRFAEWKEKESWVCTGWVEYTRNEKKPGDTKSNWVVKSMPQLIEIFKETL